MKKKLLLACVLSFMGTIAPNVLLRAPELLSTGELKQLEKDWKTHFTWHFGNLGSFSLAYEDSQAGFSVKTVGLPVYRHNYRLLPNGDEINNKIFGNSYHIAVPLVLYNAHPSTMSFEQLVLFIEKRRCIFYTGAGISAGNVATMQDLMRSLEMTKGKVHFFKHVWAKPQSITKAFDEFCKSAIYAQPSAAHVALKNLARIKSAAIITENVDLLQQRTGIKPLHTACDELRNVSERDLQAVQVVVCIGLSADDRGFLHWYKYHNPRGVIIAINFTAPMYLSDADYIHYGDIQTVVPALLERLSVKG